MEWYTGSENGGEDNFFVEDVADSVNAERCFCLYFFVAEFTANFVSENFADALDRKSVV